MRLENDTRRSRVQRAESESRVTRGAREVKGGKKSAPARPIARTVFQPVGGPYGPPSISTDLLRSLSPGHSITVSRHCLFSLFLRPCANREIDTSEREARARESRATIALLCVCLSLSLALSPSLAGRHDDSSLPFSSAPRRFFRKQAFTR